MSEFLVEVYAPRGAAPSQLTLPGVVCSIFLPEEETCLYLCQAPSVAAIREAGARDGLKFERISSATAHWTGARGPGGTAAA